MMRVLVTGAGGLLGAAITREFEEDSDVCALGRPQLDIADAAAAARIVSDVAPDVVVNCAAFNQVDAAEPDPQPALLVNAMGVLSLAQACRRIGATLVHYSSDFVFDGENNRPYREDDTPNPLNRYGVSKLLGDWFALEYDRAYVLRVESLFGPSTPTSGRRGSLNTIVDRIEQGQDVPVFVDRTVSPSAVEDVARATRKLLELKAPAGLYHCVNSGATTWAEIASEVGRILGQPVRHVPLTLASVPLVAPRPRYCALSNAKLAAVGVVMPSWRDALARDFTGRPRRLR